MALMVCDPTASAEVVRTARPLPSNVPLPSEAAPSINVTVPVASPLPGGAGVTAAVKVTGWLKTDGLGGELMVVVVFAWATTCGDPASVPLLLGHPVLPVN